ncbi:hypothetical protein B0T14DRAFT_528358 [Immersiella caudata]|uniref:Uncharacterized protein n=1 Tax=Immersiella caudata TaxID=314043 RepID=A0AA40BUQ9_9PEZI|nr:hypothetical protein B0T14DRAFT_528358 [Immersiella caudata]
MLSHNMTQMCRCNTASPPQANSSAHLGLSLNAKIAVKLGPFNVAERGLPFSATPPLSPQPTHQSTCPRPQPLTTFRSTLILQ